MLGVLDVAAVVPPEVATFFFAVDELGDENLPALWVSFESGYAFVQCGLHVVKHIAVLESIAVRAY
jgi:hypothetical protein